MDLRQHAMRFIGQPIVAHHVNGTVHRGILHAVTPQGMYIRYYGTGNVSFNQEENSFTYSDHPNTEEANGVLPVFFGLGFLPWFGLAGFWGGGLWW